MAVAAVTPRVRTIVICDAVSASPTEDGVFTLEGVRQRLEAGSFPWRVILSVYFTTRGGEALKAEYPFAVFKTEE